MALVAVTNIKKDDQFLDAGEELPEEWLADEQFIEDMKASGAIESPRMQEDSIVLTPEVVDALPDEAKQVLREAGINVDGVSGRIPSDAFPTPNESEGEDEDEDEDEL